METLRVHISNAVNELQKLLKAHSGAEQEVRLRQLRGSYFFLWQQVILQSLDNTTAEYRTALATLVRASQVTEAAQSDSAQIGAAIALLDEGVKAVEAVVRE